MNTPNIIEEHNIEVLGRSGLTWFWGNLEVGKKYFITYDQLEGMSMMWFLSQNKINKHAEKLDADINIWEDKVRGVWFIQLCKIDRSKSIKLTQMSTPKTRLEWFNLLPEPYKQQAIENTLKQSGEERLREIEIDAYNAVVGGFNWEKSPQGSDYWEVFAEKLYRNEILLPESPTPSIDYEKVVKDLDYYRQNAEENYLTTPISVLRYIGELEQFIQSKTKEQ